MIIGLMHSSSFLSINQVFREKLHRSFKNIKVVSNRMVFDDNGHLVSFKGDSKAISVTMANFPT